MALFMFTVPQSEACACLRSPCGFFSSISKLPSDSKTWKISTWASAVPLPLTGKAVWCSSVKDVLLLNVCVCGSGWGVGVILISHGWLPQCCPPQNMHLGHFHFYRKAWSSCLLFYICALWVTACLRVGVGKSCLFSDSLTLRKKKRYRWVRRGWWSVWHLLTAICFQQTKQDDKSWRGVAIYCIQNKQYP